MKHLLAIRDLTPDEFTAILDLSEGTAGHPLQDKGVALYFEKPSARTRNSMEMAVAQLGGHPVYLQPSELGIGTTAYGVLSRGLLSGSKPKSPRDFRAHLPRFTGENLTRNEGLVDTLRQVATEKSATASQLAM